MHRRRLLSWASPIALLAAFVLAGCGGSSGEQQVLKKYFDASRLRDNTTLANIATVSFRPQEEGVIQTFSLVSVGEEQRRVLRIREQNAAQESIRKEEEEFSKRKKAFQDDADFQRKAFCDTQPTGDAKKACKEEVKEEEQADLDDVKAAKSELLGVCEDFEADCVLVCENPET